MTQMILLLKHERSKMNLLPCWSVRNQWMPWKLLLLFRIGCCGCCCCYHCHWERCCRCCCLQNSFIVKVFVIRFTKSFGKWIGSDLQFSDFVILISSHCEEQRLLEGDPTHEMRTTLSGDGRGFNSVYILVDHLQGLVHINFVVLPESFVDSILVAI